MSFLKSRTFYTLLVTFLLNGYNAISPSVSPDVAVIVNAVLMMLATYFHVNPSQNYTAPSA